MVWVWVHLICLIKVHYCHCRLNFSKEEPEPLQEWMDACLAKVKTRPFCAYVTRIIFSLRILFSATFLRHLREKWQPCTHLRVLRTGAAGGGGVLQPPCYLLDPVHKPGPMVSLRSRIENSQRQRPTLTLETRWVTFRLRHAHPRKL